MPAVTACMKFEMRNYAAEMFLPYVGQALLFEPPANEQTDSCDSDHRAAYYEAIFG
jgi:hypothetical protein